MSRHILIVEDNLELLETLAMILQMQGYSTSQAMHGEQALQRLHERAPHLIVLDLQMPVMDGWAFVEALASRGPPGADRIPLLVISASDRSPGWAAMVLRKPFDVDVFLQAVDKLSAATR